MLTSLKVAQNSCDLLSFAKAKISDILGRNTDPNQLI